MHWDMLYLYEQENLSLKDGQNSLFLDQQHEDVNIQLSSNDCRKLPPEPGVCLNYRMSLKSLPRYGG